MLDDHVHFKTKKGFIFTTRGFFHPKGFVRAAGLYYPDSSNNELIKEVDELGTGKIGNLNPGYILDLGSGKAIYVPEGEIIEKHQPFGETEKKIKEIKDPSAIKLITELERIGVSIKDMGLIGSYLINTGKEPHDVDLIVRGIKNMINIKNNFKELLKKIGAENFPNGDYINSSIQRYNVKYNEEYNDFKGMISRRWPTIYIPNKFFGKIRFTYSPEEIPSLDIPNKFGNTSVICGEVLDDEGTCFMPRFFNMKTEKGDIRVITYFWEYSYCVKKGDRIAVRASEGADGKTFLICNPKEHGIKFLEMMEIKELYELFDKLYENEVKPYIENRIARNRHTEPVYYILDNFKLRRFRGAFPIIISELYNQNRALVLPIAAASELVFCIALVQDDIIDDDEKRGEIIASHIKYGIGKCLASCDYIYALIIKMLKELENQKINPEIINIVYESFIEAHERLYKSFLDEKNEANNFKLSEEEILETYKNKTIQGTNALFCAILLCTENKDLANLIKEYSYKLAIAGQIKNDIYDATSYLINRGYSDLENGYVTYIIKKLINSFPETEREGIIEIIKNKDHDKIIKILNDKGIITLCIQDCNKFVEEAISLIKGRFPKRLEEIFLVWAEGNRKFSRKI